MPIPILDLQKEIRTPKAAEGVAPNFAKYLEAPIRAAEDALNSLAKVGENFTNVKQKEALSLDMDKANRALNDYYQGMTDLNAERDSLTGDKAVEFEAKYKERAEKLLTQVSGSANEIKNHNVKQKLINDLNNFNATNRANTRAFFDKENKWVKNQNFAAAKQKELRLFAAGQLKGPSGEAVSDVDTLMLKAEADFYANNRMNGVPDAVTNEQVMAYNGQLVDAAARNMVNASVKIGDSKPYRGAIRFIEKYEGKIDTATFNKIITQYEMEELGVEVAYKSSDFFNSDGSPKESVIHQYGRHLTPYQRTKFLQTLKNSEDKEAAANMQWQNNQYLYDKLTNMGFDVNINQDGVTLASGSVGTASFSDLFDLSMDIGAMMKHGVLIKADGQRKAFNMGEAANYQAQNGERVIYPANNDAIKKLQLQLQGAMKAQIEAGNLGFDREGLWKDERPTAFTGLKKKVYEVLYDATHPGLVGKVLRGEKEKPLSAWELLSVTESVVNQMALKGGGFKRDASGNIIKDKNNAPLYNPVDVYSVNYDELYDRDPEFFKSIVVSGVAAAMPEGRVIKLFKDADLSTTEDQFSFEKDVLNPTGEFLTNPVNLVMGVLNPPSLIAGATGVGVSSYAQKAIQRKVDKIFTPTTTQTRIKEYNQYEPLVEFAQVNTPESLEAWKSKANNAIKILERNTEKTVKQHYGEKQPKWLTTRQTKEKSLDELFFIDNKNYNQTDTIEIINSLDKKQQKEIVDIFSRYKEAVLRSKRATFESLAFKFPNSVNLLPEDTDNESYLDTLRHIGLFKPFKY